MIPFQKRMILIHLLFCVLLNTGAAGDDNILKELAVPDSCEIQELFTDGEHIAYTYRKQDQSFLNVDGEIFGPFDQINQVQWSPDGRVLAYDFSVGDQSFFCMDGKKYGPFCRVFQSGYSFFSSEGKHWACLIKEKNPYDAENFDPENQPSRLLLDGEKTEPHYWIGVKWSPKNDEYYIEYIDMLYKGSVTEDNSDPFVSNEGASEPSTVTRSVYEPQKFLQFREKTYGPFHEFYHPNWAPDGRIYFETENKTAEKNISDRYLMIQDKQIGPLTGAGQFIDSVCWSPDGNHYAFVVSFDFSQDPNDSTTFVYVNDQKFGPYRDADRLTWAGDSQKCAFSVWHNDEESAARFVVVSDGRQYGPYTHTGYRYDSSQLEWSPDSQHLAFLAEKEKKHFAVIDGEEIGPFEQVQFMIPAWHKTNQQFSFKVREENAQGWSLFEGKKRASGMNGPFQSLWPLWSPDGRCFVYTQEQHEFDPFSGETGRKCIAIQTNRHNTLGTLPKPVRDDYDIEELLKKSYYAWSADSRRLAVAVPYTFGEQKTYVLFASGLDNRYVSQTNAERCVLESEMPIKPFWSPDSAKLGYIAQLGLGWQLPHIDQRRYSPYYSGIYFGWNNWRWTPDNEVFYCQNVTTPEGRYGTMMIMNDRTYWGHLIDNHMIYLDGNRVKLRKIPELHAVDECSNLSEAGSHSW